MRSFNVSELASPSFSGSILTCFQALLYLAFLATSLALPLNTSLSPDPLLLPRQACLDTCGTICYYSRTVSAAQSKGYSLYSSGSDISSYPHVYNNLEGFDFPVTGPYYEFPILRTFEVYTGGSPGPDRVIFNDYDEYAGLITHQGASGNEFEECT